MAEAKKSSAKTTKTATKPKETAKEKTDNIEDKTTNTPSDKVVTKEVLTTKAGKRSPKAQKELAEKQAKEQRKTSDSSDTKAVKPVKITRSKLERKGKLFRKSAEQIDSSKTYNLNEAVKLAQGASYVKFDASVELHINLGVDPRHSDQNIRDILVLPAGTGKKVKVAVFSDDPSGSKQAGADIAGNEEFLAQLDKGVIDFDVLVATPNLMSKLGKYARLLGPRGLMPNPKSGTVTTDINKAIAEAKAGKVEYRVDSTGIVHLGVGKVSFSESDLIKNAEAVLISIKGNKPSSLKGNYIKAIHVTTTMGPSVSVDISTVN